MAQPITWRNVNGPSLADASAPMRAAAASFNGAFDQLGGVLQRHEDIQQANVLALDEAAKQSYLDAVQGASTPEALAQQATQLASLRAGLSAKSRAATRGAEEARLTAVRQNTLAGQEFSDKQLDREQTPLREQIMAHAARGESQQALALLAANPSLRRADEMAKAVVGGERDLKRFTWDGENQKQGLLKSNADIAHQRNQDAIGFKNANTNAGQLALQKKESEFRTFTGLQEHLSKVREQYGATSADDPRTSKGSEALFGSLTKNIKDPGELAAVRALVGKAMLDDKYKGLTTGDFETAALALKNVNGWFTGDSGSTLTKHLDALVERAKENPGAAQRREATLLSQGLQLKDVQTMSDLALRQVAERFNGMPIPGGAPAPAGRIPLPPPTGAQPVQAPVAPAPTREAVMADLRGQQALLERDEIAAGTRKAYTPEVQKFIQESQAAGAAPGQTQAERDRASIVSGAKSLWGGVEGLGAVLGDTATLPQRAYMKLANQLARIPNAFGAGLEPIDEGRWGLNSMTPYLDSLGQSRQQPATDPDSLKARRKDLERALAEVTKKAW